MDGRHDIFSTARDEMSPTVTIHHNLASRCFVWLWMKYVTGVNDAHHCTNGARGVGNL